MTSPSTHDIVLERRNVRQVHRVSGVVGHFRSVGLDAHLARDSGHGRAAASRRIFVRAVVPSPNVDVNVRTVRAPDPTDIRGVRLHLFREHRDEQMEDELGSTGAHSRVASRI